MNDFTASNGVSVSRQPPVTDRGSWLMVDGHMTSPNDAQALREFFQHERDEERGLWRSPTDPSWTTVRRNTTIYFQNEDHERNFWFIVGNDATLKPWSGDLQAVAREYLEAHPERKPWHSAKPGEIWVLTIDDSEQVVSAVQQYEKDFNPISHPIYATFANGSEHITDARRIWPADAS